MMMKKRCWRKHIIKWFFVSLTVRGIFNQLLTLKIHGPPKLHPKLFTGSLICIYFLTKHILSNSAGSIILSNIKRCHTCKCFNSVFLQKSKTMYIYLWVIGVKLCVYLRVHACSWADFFYFFVFSGNEAVVAT